MANEPITTGNSYTLITDHSPGALDSDYKTPIFWFNEVTEQLFWPTDLTPDAAVWKEVTLV